MRVSLVILVILAMARVVQAGTVNILVTPAQVDAQAGQSFVLTIQVQAGSQDINTAGAHVDFDPAILQVESVDQGTRLTTVVQNTFNNNLGTFDYAAAILSDVASGTFTLATVHAHGISPGTTGWTFFTTLPRRTSAFLGASDETGTITDGSVTITGGLTPTPSRTSTITPTETPTGTPTGPTLTPTITPTPAPTPRCCGDCDNNNQVTTSELGNCLSILTGAADLSTCPRCDCDSDREVLVTDYSQAEINAYAGCPGGPPPNAPQGFAVNPRGTDAVISGALQCRGSTNRACVHLPVLTDAPTSPVEGDMWLQESQGWCWSIGGQTKCVVGAAP